MTDVKYRRASDTFLKALKTLATSPEPLERRLINAFNYLGNLDKSNIPPDLNAQFQKLESDAHRFGNYEDTITSLSEDERVTLATQILELFCRLESHH